MGFAIARPVFQRGMAAIVALPLLLVAAGPLQAADKATAELVGFSQDGRYVAFEQFGSQDGSGFPYAEIFIIDVAANDWAVDPIRVLIDNDALAETLPPPAAVMKARQEAATEARNALASLGIIQGNVGTQMIHRPYTDLDAAPHIATFSMTAVATSYIGERHQVLLTERPAASPDCEYFGPNVIFTLTLQPDGGVPVVLQEDRQLFSSRGCPHGYRIEQVVLYGPLETGRYLPDLGSYAMFVLVGMSVQGFEGDDIRYLGVTAHLPEGVL